VKKRMPGLEGFAARVRSTGKTTAGDKAGVGLNEFSMNSRLAPELAT
jgi:hypothetical protein